LIFVACLFATTANAQKLSPQDIVKDCDANPKVSTVSVSLGGSKYDLILMDCHNVPDHSAEVYLTLGQERTNKTCSVDLTGAYVDAGFTMTPHPNKVVLHTHLLPGSSGVVPPWTIDLTKVNGRLEAASTDGQTPRVECE
jgi:hypothetical protein